ncbi:DUF4433 domain-containing protein [Roseibium sp.]|uniref:DUF4433 domain-containing protein n=1 Tax=Roseibium sp. TaxID=1936156 RepID=UPI003A97BB0E
MTYFQNLRRYLADGRVYAKNHRNMQPGFRISFSDIVQRRGTAQFTTPCGSNVNDFVPFYFSPITKMAYTIHVGNVRAISPTNADLGIAQMEDVAYLVVEPSALFGSGRDCWFTDLACNSAIPPSYQNQPAQLASHVNWALFDEAPLTATINEIGYAGVCRWQHDRDQPVRYQMRSKQRMAEFMVKDYLSMDEVLCIILKNDAHLATVQGWVNESGASIPVYVKPRCYF